MKCNKVFLIGIVSLVLLFTSCPQSAEPDISMDVPTGTMYEFTTSDGVEVSVESPVEVIITELVPADYPEGVEGSIVDIVGTLGVGQTATVVFSNTTAYDTDSAIMSYNGSIWEPQTTDISSDGKTLTATVDHFSPHGYGVPLLGLSIVTEEIILIAGNNMTLSASITPTTASNPDITWATDDPCVTVIPHPTVEAACWIVGNSSGFARITATADANPAFSEGFNITVITSITLSSGALPGMVEDDDLESYYVVTGLTPGADYIITVSDISPVSIPDYEAVVGTVTAVNDTLDPLYSAGYTEDEAPMIIQGFAGNDGDIASIIFKTVSDWAYFAVVDGSEFEDLGTFTYNIDVALFSPGANTRIIETIPCNAGNAVDTFLTVYDENEIVICGAFDKTPDDAYSRVIVPTLPNPFYIRISAQEEDDRVVSGYGATGDYALNIMSGTTEGYLGVLPNTISTDTDERAYEENPGYLNNYMYWPTINVGTLLDPDPYVRIINEDGDVTPEGSDIDMFKSW